MTFNQRVNTTLPAEVVYETLRDSYDKLAIYSHNIKKIETLEREKTENGVKTVSKWYAEYLNKKIAWLDIRECFDNKHTCVFTLEPFVFKEYIDIHGENACLSKGRHSTVTMTGDINMYVRNEAAISPVLKNKVDYTITKIAYPLIKPNFSKIIKGIQQYIKKNNPPTKSI